MYKCLICGKKSEGSQKAHIMPESMGFHNSIPTSSICDCDSTIGSQANVHLKRLFNFDTLCRQKYGFKCSEKRLKSLEKNDFKPQIIVDNKSIINLNYKNSSEGPLLLTYSDRNDPKLLKEYDNLPENKKTIGKYDFSINPVAIYYSLAHSLILLDSLDHFFRKNDKDILLQKLKKICDIKKVRDCSKNDIYLLLSYPSKETVGTGFFFLSDGYEEHCYVLTDNAQIQFFNFFISSRMYTVEINYKKNEEEYKISSSIVDLKKIKNDFTSLDFCIISEQVTCKFNPFI